MSKDGGKNTASFLRLNDCPFSPWISCNITALQIFWVSRCLMMHPSEADML